MKLHVFHRTRYDYAAPARDSFNEARLQPVTGFAQTCQQFLLRVLPPARLTHFRDFQLNTVHVFDVTEPHTALEVEASSTVITSDASVLSLDAATSPLSAMGACVQIDRCHDFLQPSRYVDTGPETWKLAMDATAGAEDAWQAAQAVMGFVHREFAYIPASTNVHTHMREVLPLRRGVCQDFAHVMIGMCRTIQIPTRYVSGYLYNGPVDQLRGAQASHAWVEVFLPELGWRALDPTNSTQPDERYVKVAVGRDYADVSPLRGTYRGTPQRRMTVEVLVSAPEAAPAPA